MMHIIQIMNGYECDGIEVKDGMFYLRGEAKLNRTFHLSPNENIMYHCTNEKHTLFDLYNIENIFLH